MPTKIQNISGLFSNARSRMVIILTILMLGVGLFIGLSGLLTGGAEPESAFESSVARIPRTDPTVNLDAPPTQKYLEVQEEAERRALARANETGESVIPPLLGSKRESSSTPFLDDLTIPGGDTENKGSNSSQGERSEQSQQTGNFLPEVDEAARRAEIATAEQTNKLQSAMRARAQSLFKDWSQTRPQAFVAGAQNPTGQEGTGRSGETRGESGNADVPHGKPLIKAGKIIFAVMNTSVNSDEPGPVMATVVLGQYKGAKLLGTTKRVEDRLILTFNTFNIPEKDDVIKIDAIAIDPDTARTALASDVNYHYFLRYGTLFASSFLQGYGEAISQGGTTSRTGDTTTTTTPTLGPAQRFATALGKVGSAWGRAVNYFDTPPTVTLDSGAGIGVLFVSSVRG